MTEKNQRAVNAALRPDHDRKLLELPPALLEAGLLAGAEPGRLGQRPHPRRQPR